MSTDENEIVGTVRTILKKFEGDDIEGKEPVEIIESTEPLLRKEAVALGLIKGEDNVN